MTTVRECARRDTYIDSGEQVWVMRLMRIRRQHENTGESDATDYMSPSEQQCLTVYLLNMSSNVE